MGNLPYQLVSRISEASTVCRLMEMNQQRLLAGWKGPAEMAQKR